MSLRIDSIKKGLSFSVSIFLLASKLSGKLGGWDDTENELHMCPCTFGLTHSTFIKFYTNNYQRIFPLDGVSLIKEMMLCLLHF